MNSASPGRASASLRVDEDIDIEEVIAKWRGQSNAEETLLDEDDEEDIVSFEEPVFDEADLDDYYDDYHNTQPHAQQHNSTRSLFKMPIDFKEETA